ncbi:MAG: hypothetical protein PHI31_18995 [Desulfuromonadaceae bacterium]|nr:hypothetical protein [Desulfuromonadaceae bacterium]
MTTTKKNAEKTPRENLNSKAVSQIKTDKRSQTAPKPEKEKSRDELMADNFTALSTVVDSLSLTIEMLVQKIEGIAYHTIATEEILAELVATNGLNLARVNARIRAKIAAGTDNNGNANQAIDVAAAIASPLPRR